MRTVIELATAAFFLALTFLAGCASAPPPPPKWSDRVDVSSAVYVRGDTFACSGVAVGDHTVLTAAHCMDKGEFEIVAFPGVSYPVTKVELWPGRDLAWVTTGGARLAVQARFALKLPDEGDLVFGAGFGCYGALAVEPGLYVTRRQIDGALVFAMGSCHGDSGGPVFNDDGELIGIITAKSVDSPLTLAEALGQ